ncbi:MAG TPA: hypothetical protein VN642_01115 [Dongiaceae bacterium]|nr:hypothetical protein [Dongiaceae bacterium]
MYRRRSKKQKHEEIKWGLGLGSIMLLAVSVSVSSCDIRKAPSGRAFNGTISGIMTTTDCPQASSRRITANGSMLINFRASSR